MTSTSASAIVMGSMAEAAGADGGYRPWSRSKKRVLAANAVLGIRSPGTRPQAQIADRVCAAEGHTRGSVVIAEILGSVGVVEAEASFPHVVG